MIFLRCVMTMSCKYHKLCVALRCNVGYRIMLMIVMELGPCFLVVKFVWWACPDSQHVFLTSSPPRLHVAHGFLQAMLLGRCSWQLLEILGEFIDIMVQHHLQGDFLVVIAVQRGLWSRITHSIEHLFPMSVEDWLLGTGCGPICQLLTCALKEPDATN